MLPIIFYLLRTLVQLLPSPESAETLRWNEAVSSLAENKMCTQALELYDKQDSLAIKAFAETRLKICSCLLKQGQRQELSMILNGFQTRPRGRFSSSVWNERALFAAAVGDTANAIFLLRRAIETENRNTFAKYNFELLSKLYRPRNSQQNNAANQSMNRSGEIEKNNKKKDELQSNSPPEIGLAMALKLLDAMRTNEFNKPALLKATKKDTANYGRW